MNPKNPYETRWRWWYSSIADWMIRNPGRDLTDCAKEMGRGYSTICMITNTDMFRTYLETRKAEWRKSHDFGLVDKLTRVAEGGLDLILDVMKKKGDQIPMKELESLTVGALNRLGYAPASSAAVAVTVQQNDNRTAVMVTAPVSAAQLEEARDALRLAEQRRAAMTLEHIPIPTTVGVEGPAAELTMGLADYDVEDTDAPVTISAQ